MPGIKNCRIIFLGTPVFAVAVLDMLVKEGCEVVGVVTAPDKQAGRGMQLSQSAVKKYAVEKGLHVMQPVKLKDPSFLEELKSLQADVQVVVAFRMLPEAVWNMPLMGTINLHASMLPQYRVLPPSIGRSSMGRQRQALLLLNSSMKLIQAICSCRKKSPLVIKKMQDPCMTE